MEIISSILYILLFVFCLSVLIVVHECGHLIAAKSFNVYCHEFSIGFGPKIFSKKRRFGETYFSMRCIPFGGYVSMYGEGVEIPDGNGGIKEIAPQRSLNGIAKWKRAIILLAGVTMNALLALTVFFFYEGCFPKTDLYAANITVGEVGTVAYDAGMRTEDLIYIEETNLQYVYGIDKAGVIEHNNGDTETVYVVLDGSRILGYNKLSWGYYLHFCYADADGNIAYDKQFNTDNLKDVKCVKFAIYKLNVDEEKQEAYKSEEKFDITLDVVYQTTDSGEILYAFEDLGLYLTKEEHYNKNLGETVKNTFVDFGQASAAIVKGFVAMFTTSEGFQSAGGLIAIANETTNILKNYGLSNFIYAWGLISVNLAIVNLFPFPGLDGWQLLVLIVEGIAHKEIPNKVKTILSVVGILLLFAVMILLLIKDAFIYIF